MQQVSPLIAISAILIAWVSIVDVPAQPTAVNDKPASVDQFEPIPFQWIEINPNAPGGLPGTQILFYVDPIAGPFGLGFDFPYYHCDIFDETYVCLYGFSSFTSTIGATYANASVPSTYQPNNLLAIYWDDIYLSTTGSVWYYPDSTNNRFIIEWFQMQFYAYGGVYTFESILYPDGTVEYYHQTIQHGSPNSCTIGIENIAGTEGIQATYNGSGPFEPLSQTAIRFDPVCLEPVDDLVISLDDGADSNHVVLTWSSILNALQYHIYKSTTGWQSGYILIASTTETTYIDSAAVETFAKSFYYITADNNPLDSGVNLTSPKTTSNKPAAQNRVSHLTRMRR